MNRDAAIRFYKFHNNPEVVNLFARGLWMPLQKAYYTEPEKMKLWLDNAAHPTEAQPTFTDYIVNYQTGSDVIVWLSDQSANANTAFIAY